MLCQEWTCERTMATSHKWRTPLARWPAAGGRVDVSVLVGLDIHISSVFKPEEEAEERTNLPSWKEFEFQNVPSTY